MKVVGSLPEIQSPASITSKSNGAFFKPSDAITGGVSSSYTVQDSTTSVQYLVNEVQVAPDFSDWILRGQQSKVKAGMPFATVATTLGLTAAKLKVGEDILGITGTFTSDGDATADDLVLNKKAYVNGNKITGNLRVVANPTNIRTSGYDGVFFKPADAVSSEYGVYTVTGNVSPYNNQTFLVNWVKASSSQNWAMQGQQKMKVGMPLSDVATAISLTAGQIKQGETVLGVAGSYEGTELGVGTELDLATSGTTPSGWQEIEYDTGWVNLTIDTTKCSIASSSGGNRYTKFTPQIRRIGNMVHLRGKLVVQKSNITADTVIPLTSTILSKFLPDDTEVYIPVYSMNATYVDVTITSPTRDDSDASKLCIYAPSATFSSIPSSFQVGLTVSWMVDDLTTKRIQKTGVQNS